MPRNGSAAAAPLPSRSRASRTRSAAAAALRGSLRGGKQRTVALLVLALAGGIAAWWQWWPLDAWPTAAQALAQAEAWRAQPLAPLVALALFAASGLVVFPVNLSIAAMVVVFGPWPGGVYAWLGSVLSAALVYEIGRLLPATTAARWFGARGERLRRRIVGHGIIAMAVLRLLPVAPYSVVGFMAGVARVRRLDYLAGTAIGMLPGVVLYALFVDRARAALLDPHPGAWLALLGAVVLLVAAAFSLRAWKRRIAARAGVP
jgi:phospholipase D1/2